MKDRDFSQSRSDKYQANIIETCIDYKLFSHLPNEEKLFYSNPLFAEDRDNKINRLEEIKIELANKIYSIAEKTLTKKQYQVFTMCYRDGFNQMDAAKKLGQNQSTIHHVLYGNFSRRSGPYGGCKKRVLKNLDDETMALFSEMKRLQDEIADLL